MAPAALNEHTTIFNRDTYSTLTSWVVVSSYRTLHSWTTGGQAISTRAVSPSLFPMVVIASATKSAILRLLNALGLDTNTTHAALHELITSGKAACSYGLNFTLTSPYHSMILDNMVRCPVFTIRDDRLTRLPDIAHMAV